MVYHHALIISVQSGSAQSVCDMQLFELGLFGDPTNKIRMVRKLLL